MKHVAKVCIDRLISVPSRGDKLETTPQQQAWKKSLVKSMKSLVRGKSVQFLSLHDEKWICHNMKWCRGSNSEALFFKFNSKTFWGFTEMGCLPVCSLLSWLIRKNKLRLWFLNFWLFLILYVLLTTASPFFYNSKRLSDIFCTFKHHLLKVPTQQYKLLAFLFFLININ